MGYNKKTECCGAAKPARRNPWKLLLIAAALGTWTASAASPTLIGTDVGSPSVPGSVKTAADGKITVVGGGSDIWGNSDNFYYAYFKVTGDFDYVLKVESLTGNAGDGGWAKAELMARQEDPANAGAGPQGGDLHISNMTTRPASDIPPTDPDTGTVGSAGNNNRGPQWRATRDGASSWTAPSPAIRPNMPDNWVRLERVGSVFYMYASEDGKTWSMYNPYSPQGWDTKGSWPPGTDSPDVSVFTEAWPNTVFLGLAVTGHNDGSSATAVISNFASYTPVPVAISKQPEPAATLTANNQLTLSVTATGDPVHYEWRKNGTPIPRAVGATYTVALAQPSDSGTYTVRVFGGGKEILSTPSVVSVTVDTLAPTVTRVQTLPSPTRLTVIFSEPVTPTTATVAANYQISGGVSVTSAALSADGMTATLVTSQQALNTSYTLTVNNVKDTAGLTTANATATFVSVSLFKGSAYYERWTDANGDLGNITAFGTALADGTARQPDVGMMVNQFGAPWGAGDQYNARVRTFFTPATSGNYVFFSSTDDESRVYLSTDEDPANKKLICQETGWSNQYQWLTKGDGGSADEKRSDYSAANEYGNPITLVANKQYYMEVLMNEGGGGDGSDVTFIKEGEADPTTDAAGMALKGDVIGWYDTLDILPPVIVTEPIDSLTIPAGGTGTLSVVATNSIAGSLSYQWKLNGKNIAGATSASYVISNASPLDIGQYWVTISNGRSSVTSGQNDTPTVVLVTATGVFNIEAEDFNYDNGKCQAVASTMPYQGDAYNGLDAVFDVDYHNTGATTSADGWNPPYYRVGEPTTSGTSVETGGNNGGQWGLTRAGEWEMTQNYKIGWVGSGDWGNYTRTFPSGTYYVFAAQSQDSTAASQLLGNIAFVTGATTTTQSLTPIGNFDAPGTGGWSRNNLVAMTDNAGKTKTLTFASGEQTIRWTFNNGDADYLLFIPATTTPTGGFTSVTLSGNSMVIAWTGGTLESGDAVAGPWTVVPNAVSPATIPTTGTKKFYRLK